MTTLPLENIDYSTIPWDRLVHFQGRAIDVPTIINVIENGNTSDQRMALVTLAGLIEHKGGVIITTPIVLHFLFKKLQTDQANKSLLLRIILKIAKAVAYQWEVFLDSNEFEGKTFSSDIWKPTSVYLWEPYQSKDKDELLWATANAQLFFDDAWHYTKEVLLAYKDIVAQLQGMDLISQGHLEDLLTILKMIKDQKRQPFSLSKKWSSQRLMFSVITPEDIEHFTTHFTPEISQYLSFDITKETALLKEYIRRSGLEVEKGTALVLVVRDIVTHEFLGSCALNDINCESVEIGLWLKKQAQGKGYATEIVTTLIDICKTELSTCYIIYSVEKDNLKSIAVAKNLNFTKAKEFIIEPSVFKNRMREMKQYLLYI
ncbi:GNAT family N-acetyltransferase [Myroides injenensis]|uniref:GNAT family N-acetyltransferase n=1 Tax=Myroides injenensis TaxID=1183151 RepID=UPI000289BE9E|nr:GNAT family N-acetyltransferase [Myroides injenensis]